MEVFKAVVVDLLQFAIASTRKMVRHVFGAGSASTTFGEVFKPLSLGAPIAQHSLPMIKDYESPLVLSAPILTNNEFVAVDQTPLYTHPTVTFDGLIVRLPYGATVTVLQRDGRWTSVTWQSFSGWILKDALTTDFTSLLPVFGFGLLYNGDSEDTQKLRRYIHDEYGGGVIEYPLTSGEYVTYRLAQKGVEIPWSAKRPRQAGQWQKLLKGTSGTYSGIVPKTGSVMEFLTDECGQLAYVEAVFPDETIRVSYISEDGDPCYFERVLTKDEWKELRPVFIDFV